ncbi:MAG: hypothetical protein HFJ43_02895 [Clostridia bacterium]|nr:hypothetical protein [Clostridia bacterium]
MEPEDEIKVLRDKIAYYKENDGRYIFDTSKSGDMIRRQINYEDHIMRILILEVEKYAKIFEEEKKEKNVITYILFEIYASSKYTRLLDFNKFIRYLETYRSRIENNEIIMSKISMLYKLLDSNRIIDRKDILSFLSEGYKNFAENDNKSEIYINVLSKEQVIRIVEEDKVVSEINNILRFLIYVENEKGQLYKKQKLNLKKLEPNEEKTLVL